MRNALAQSEAIAIQREGNVLALTFRSDFTFAVNSAAIRSGLDSELSRVAQVLNAYPQTTLTVAKTIVGYLYIPSGFVSVSGDYERFFRQDGVVYHHILDPETGWPADTGISSVAVHTTNGASADALSTALFVMGLEEGMALYESGKIQFEAVFITADNRIIVTPGLLEDGRFEMTSKEYTMGETE